MYMNELFEKNWLSTIFLESIVSPLRAGDTIISNTVWDLSDLPFSSYKVKYVKNVENV